MVQPIKPTSSLQSSVSLETLAPGDKISLKCHSSHADLWKFIKDGSEEFGYQGNQVIVISAYKEATDKGEYSCQAKDSLSGLESDVSIPVKLTTDTD